IENVGGKKRPRASTAAGGSVVRGFVGIVAGKSLKHRQARNERRVQRSRLRQRVGIWAWAIRRRRRRIQAAHATSHADARRHRKKWSLKGKRIRGAYVLANVIDSKACANGGGMAAQKIISQADTRPKCCGIIFPQRRAIAGVSGK